MSFAALLAFAAAFASAGDCRAQVNYVARFVMEKSSFLLGEPIFCEFTIKNTGTRPFVFSYRTPDRAANRELEQEPRFVVRGEKGSRVADPAPHPCGGARGSVVYGSVTLPPGETHMERWLLDQWARIARPGHFRLRAERRLALLPSGSETQAASQPPAGYAMAINELAFDVHPSTEVELEKIFQPYLAALDEKAGAKSSEAYLAIVTSPRPFLLGRLETIAGTRAEGERWDRKRALEGLARLGTPAAWAVIRKIARGNADSSSTNPPDAVRDYAVLMLGERADPASIPTLVELVSASSEELRGEALRALGFFHQPRANQVLFERLHSSPPNDRVNAILGLKNLENSDAIPALLAMLSDPEPQVRQVAHFALRSLTGSNIKLSPGASRGEAAQVEKLWRAWWLGHGPSFVPLRQPPCHDW